MGWLKAHRRATVLVMCVAATAGIIAWYLTLPSNDDGLSMGYYGPDKQREWADRLVAGLNTHNADEVPIHRIYGKQLSMQKVAVESAMPAPGCRYDLDSVEDRGEQTDQDVPGLSGQRSTYRFEMTVEQQCAGRQATTRKIGVIAIADMGYWNPFYFVVE
ncbi:hypothetical protein [Mycolicibacterium goodii]